MTEPLVAHLLGEIAFLRRLVEQLLGGRSEPVDARLGPSGSGPEPGSSRLGPATEAGPGSARPPYSPTRTSRVRPTTQTSPVDPEEYAAGGHQAAGARRTRRINRDDPATGNTRPEDAISDPGASP